MILSNKTLQEVLEKRWVVIEPLPTPLTPTVAEECPYQTTAVDLRLGSEISMPTEKIPINIDLRDGRFRELARRFYKPYQITEQQPFALQPNTFVLGRTVESVGFPLPKNKDDLCFAGRIEGRSSYARCGLAVHLTAPTIHAGYDGVITLEICNFGPYIIQLYPEMYICQLIVEHVEGRPFKNDSQFQGQTGPNGTCR